MLRRQRGQRGLPAHCRACVRWIRRLHWPPTPQQRLVEIGRLETPKRDEQYHAGQFFLHRLFGYRGVVLFPWSAMVYDRDQQRQSTVPVASWEEEGFAFSQASRGVADRMMYYQALIDQRDFKYIRPHPEAITFLSDKNDSSLYSIAGLDYVTHDDIRPFTCTEQEPKFQHELFSQFLDRSDSAEGGFDQRQTLHLWRERNRQWLQLTDVHRETTRGVRVSVMPFYMGRREASGVTMYWWRYHIRLENCSGEKVQLKERHWRIFSALGTIETVKGKGVVGEEPVLSQSCPAFQYSSHVSLQSPSGYMWGTFRMERQDKRSFLIRVPPFRLESHHLHEPETS